MKKFLCLVVFIVFIVTLFMPVKVVLADTKYRVVVPEVYDTIFVGDSRTVGILKTCPDANTAYICEVGQGLDWLKSKAQNQVKSLAKANTKVIFNLGVNDLGNIDQYVFFYTDLFAELERTGCTVYLVSVNPVGDKSHISNESIEQFNNTLKASFPNVRFIDTNSECQLWGYETVDGVHYSKSTTQFINSCIYASF